MAVDLCSRWIQSASTDYDILFAPILHPRRVMNHKPVVSTRPSSHVLYTQAINEEPGGKLVVCHDGCEAALQTKVRKGYVKFTCTDCESTAPARQITPRRDDIIGNHQLTKTPYPQEHCPVTWKRHNPGKPKKFRQTPSSLAPAHPSASPSTNASPSPIEPSEPPPF